MIISIASFSIFVAISYYKVKHNFRNSQKRKFCIKGDCTPKEDSSENSAGICSKKGGRIHFLNPIPPGLFEGGAAWGGGGECPRPITLKLLMIMK